MASSRVMYQCDFVSMCEITLDDGTTRYKVSDDQFGHREKTICGRDYDPYINKDFYSFRNAFDFYQKLIVKK